MKGAKGIKIQTNPSSKCPLCALPLSSQMNEAIFFRTLTDEVMLRGINKRLGIFVTSRDLKEHRERHLGFEIKKSEELKEINELEEIDSRIQAIQARLQLLDARGEIYSQGYATLSRTLVDLVKIRNEIREGKKLQIEGKISIQDWFKKHYEKEEEEASKA